MTSTTIQRPPYPAADCSTVRAVLASFAALAPQAPLVTDDERTLSAGEMAELAGRLDRALAAAGLRAGDPVGILMANGWRWIAAYLALASQGYVAVPLNTWYKETELRSASAKARLRAVLTQSVLHGRDNEALLAGAGLLDPDGEYLGALMWNGDFPERLDPDAPPLAGQANPSGSDVAVYAFTSGSSAEPKVVVLRHDGLVDNGWAMGQRLGAVPGESVWFAAPLFFGLGCANAVFVALTHGLELCVQERFEPHDSAAFIERHRCSVFYGLGPITRGLAQPSIRTAYDLSSLTKGVIGMSAEDKRIAIEELGLVRARSVYGLTECYGLGAMTEEGDDPEAVIATQGRPVDGQELRLIDPVSGDRVQSGTPETLGEIQLRGRTTPGYLDNDEANAQAFTADGWFRTGDLGWIDEAGRLHFAGRLKEVVKINGITISPAEVEDYVTEHPDVSQAYAFGWPTAERGEEELWCAVVLDDRSAMSPAEVDGSLRSWLRARISSYKVPSHFVVLDGAEVPLTATGKVSKRLIGEQFVVEAAQ
ncbi:acyl--CoA ligase [Aeromicrobium sp. YIM 150415]|uniref:class I adenylate-forming enzyme family protein n=1 Tax=Aeromicrobium sp. YIM 150415 TaxID=2803912 RepID=UPI0019655B35|nr:class I adenylate-forming enzyme family protein [Aeromicrobium sp. YIM 150415]MBM9464402.1 acyl--CoA ligase [Aeromicrobium sp. YIM 150415]